MDQVWSQVQDMLRKELGSQNFEIWIQPIHLTSIDEHEVQLQLPNRYYRDWVQPNYGSRICEFFQTVLSRPVNVQFLLEAPKAEEPASKPSTNPAHGQSDPVQLVHTQPNDSTLELTATGISSINTFESFVVGASNQFAHAASMAVAESPGEPQYNPLFIYGGTGLGKTHLLHSIANSIRISHPSSRILYVNGEQFTNELIDALRYKQMPEFRDKYRKLPTLLLMDDVQFFSGKERIQEELFHTFEWLKERGRQIVFTSDKLPRDIKGFEPRLRTRCENGMLADVQPPDLETLIAIMYQKAELQGLNISPELAQYIGPRVRGSIRELEGVLHRLKMLCNINGVQPDIEFAKKHLSSVLNEGARPISPDEIIQTVSNFFNYSISDLKGKRRNKPLVLARHVAMWLIRKRTNLSFPQIGMVFDRDHATVQHACKKIRKDIVKDADLKSTIDAITRNLSR